MKIDHNFLVTDTLVDEISIAGARYIKQDVFFNPSYEKGLLGFSLFYGYLARYREDDSSQAMAELCFNKALEALSTQSKLQPHLAKSIDYFLAQVGRYIQFVSGHNLLDVSADGYLVKLDKILFDLMKTKIAINDYDTASGALAAGHYFITRMRAGTDLSAPLSHLAHSINKAALRDADGDYYWECPTIHNRIYLGLSHGSGAIISLMASLYELEVERTLCAEIMQKGVNFLLKQYRETPYKGLFPNMMGDAVAPMQFSLCYGDLGVGYALERASKVLHDAKLEAAKQAVLSDCLTRAREDNLTLDASIYYGASGLGIAFDKLAQITSDSKFSVRANYWYDQIPSYATHANDFNGFQTRLNRDEPTWKLWNVSFGWGVLGIGTALMQAQNKQLPSLANLTFVV